MAVKAEDLKVGQVIEATYSYDEGIHTGQGHLRISNIHEKDGWLYICGERVTAKGEPDRRLNARWGHFIVHQSEEAKA